MNEPFNQMFKVFLCSAIAVADLAVPTFAQRPSGPTISPSRGGVSCAKWQWQEYIVLEPLRCGLEGGGSSKYRRYVGYDCRQTDASGRVIGTYSMYVVPNSNQWLGCENAL